MNFLCNVFHSLGFVKYSSSTLRFAQLGSTFEFDACQLLPSANLVMKVIFSVVSVCLSTEVPVQGPPPLYRTSAQALPPPDIFKLVQLGPHYAVPRPLTHPPPNPTQPNPTPTTRTFRIGHI